MNALFFLLCAVPALANGPVTIHPLAGDPAKVEVGYALSGWLARELDRIPAIEASLAEVHMAPSGRDLSGSWQLEGQALTVVLHSSRGAPSTIQGSLQDLPALRQQLLSEALKALNHGPRRALPWTNSWEAWTAWGGGQRAWVLDDLPDAMSWIMQAIVSDPDFLGAWVTREDIAFQQTVQRRHPGAPAEVTLVNAFSMPDATSPTVDSLAGWALRLMAFENQDRPCRRAEEMLHYLDATNFAVRLPPGHTDTEFSTRVAVLAREKHFTAVSRSFSELPESAFAMPQRRASGMFNSTADFILREASARNVAGSGLFGAAVQCLPPRSAMSLIDTLALRARRAGVSAERQSGRPAPPWTLGESLDLGWAWVVAQSLGPIPELETRLQGLVQGRNPADLDVRQILQRSELLRETAANLSRRMRPRDEVIARLRGAADGASNVVRSEPWGCGEFLRARRGDLYAWLAEAQAMSGEDPAIHRTYWARGVAWMNTLEDLGCFVHQEARASNDTQVVALVRQRLKDTPPGAFAQPECASTIGGLRVLASAAQVPSVELLESYHMGWFGSCVEHSTTP